MTPAEVLDLAATAAGPPDWTAALCAQADPDAWYPEVGGSTRSPKAICRRCPIRAECLAYALARDERFGVWGGTGERERRFARRHMITGSAKEVTPCSVRSGATRSASGSRCCGSRCGSCSACCGSEVA